MEHSARVLTEWGNGIHDSRILSASTIFSDSLNPLANKTQFNFGFHWVPYFTDHNIY